MSDTAYIVAAWAGTFAAVGLYAFSVIRRGRKLKGAAAQDGSFQVCILPERTWPETRDRHHAGIGPGRIMGRVCDPRGYPFYKFRIN